MPGLKELERYNGKYKLSKEYKSDNRRDGIHILSIGAADERYFSQVSKRRKDMLSSSSEAKRHFGYHADEPQMPLRDTSFIRHPVI